MPVRISSLPAADTPTGSEVFPAVQGSTTVKMGITAISRLPLSSNTNFYVDNATGSDSNPGTSGSPFASVQYAYDYLSNRLDLRSYTVTINVSSGSSEYSRLNMTNGWVGGIATSPWTPPVSILGAAGLPQINGIFSGYGNLLFTLGGPVFIQNFVITPYTGYNMIVNSGFVLINTVQFGLAGGANATDHILISHGARVRSESHTVKTGALHHVNMAGGSRFENTGGITFDSSANLVFTSCAAGFFDGIFSAEDGCFLSISGFTVTAGTSVFGQQFYLQNSLLHSEGPYSWIGNIPGIVGEGSYVSGQGFDPVQVVTPSTGGDTVSMSNLSPYLIVATSSTMSSLTINLPWNNTLDSRLINGFRARITTIGAITSLTIASTHTSPPAIVGAPTTMSSNSVIGFVYDNSNGWYLN